jgi:hypothetical protein
MNKMNLILAMALTLGSIVARAETFPPGDYTIFDTSGNGLGEYSLHLDEDSSMILTHDGKFCKGTYEVSGDPTHFDEFILTLHATSAGCERYRNAKIGVPEVPPTGDGVTVSAKSLFPPIKNIDTDKIHMARSN